MLKYLHDNFYSETKNIVAKIKTYVTEQSIYDILCKYDEVLSEDRKKLIQNYLLSKIQLLKEVYKEEEQEKIICTLSGNQRNPEGNILLVS